MDSGPPLVSKMVGDTYFPLNHSKAYGLRWQMMLQIIIIVGTKNQIFQKNKKALCLHFIIKNPIPGVEWNP